MRLTNLLGLSIIFVISACAPPAFITDTQGKQVSLYRYVPPTIYESWWKEIADCEGLDLPPEHQNVIWVVVPVRPFEVVQDTAHKRLDGFAMTPEPRIYINHTGVLDRGLVTHEMTHILLFYKYGSRYSGQDAHPSPYYAQCGLVEKGQQKL